MHPLHYISFVETIDDQQITSSCYLRAEDIAAAYNYVQEWLVTKHGRKISVTNVSLCTEDE